MKILAVSDVETSFIHSPGIVQRFAGIDLVISCGDLHPSYLDYIQSMLNLPLYFVRGNHDIPFNGSAGGLEEPYSGGVNLHRRIYRQGEIILAGMEGCLLYNREGPQFSQSEMWSNVFNIVPALLRNRLKSGRFLDIFVTHAPPWGIHDLPDDPPHHGFKAFRWLITVFHPLLHLHGHIHVFHPGEERETLFAGTRVINAYGYREINFPK